MKIPRNAPCPCGSGLKYKKCHGATREAAEPLGGIGQLNARHGEEAERRRFAVPPARGALDDIDLSLLDPADPDERRLLIEAEHPELRDALEDGDDEIVLQGQTMSPQLHITLHEIVANQLWDDDPPESWETAKRLLAEGYERHEVLHMLCSVVAREVWGTLALGTPEDHERYAAALAELPDAYFALADS
jgi:hypothetical protein